MEISELITILREDYLDDTFSGWEDASQVERDDQFLWSDKALLRYINEAQKQACNRTDFLFDDEEFIIALVAGSPSYSIDQKIISIEQVTFDDRITAKHRSKISFQTDNPGWRTDEGMEGKELSFIIRSRKLRIHPIPDASDAGKLLTLDTYRLPLDTITSASDELEIPEEFHRDLILWVLYEAYLKQDAETYDPKKSAGYLAQFNLKFGIPVPSEVRLNQLQEEGSSVIGPIDYMGASDDNSTNVWST